MSATDRFAACPLGHSSRLSPNCRRSTATRLYTCHIPSVFRKKLVLADSEKMRWIKEEMARPERVELPTFWFVAIAARRINHLHGMGRNATGDYRCCTHKSLPHEDEYSVSLGRVWWWAQSWAQHRGVNP